MSVAHIDIMIAIRVVEALVVTVKAAVASLVVAVGVVSELASANGHI